MVYAELSDIESRWRPLSDAERPRAQALLEQASRLVRLRVPSVDSRLASLTLEAALVADVVVAMVVRVLASGLAGSAPVTQKSVTVGNITTSQSFATASGGGLILGADELALLQPASFGSCFTLSLAGGGHVYPEPVAPTQPPAQLYDGF